MARSNPLHLFAGYRFFAVVYNRGGARGEPLALSHIESLPGRMVRFSAAHALGRGPLVRSFQGGTRVEAFIFHGNPDEERYTARRIVYSYEGVEALPLNVSAAGDVKLRTQGEGIEDRYTIPVAIDSAAILNAECTVVEDLGRDAIPEWFPDFLQPKEVRTGPRVPRAPTPTPVRPLPVPPPLPTATSSPGT